MAEALELALGVLCVWRITHLLAAEDGPADVLARLRRRLGDGFLGGLLDCFYCLSLWVAAPVALLIGRNWRAWFLEWFALSAGAILIERLVPPPVAPASYLEDKEESG